MTVVKKKFNDINIKVVKKKVNVQCEKLTGRWHVVASKMMDSSMACHRESFSESC